MKLRADQTDALTELINIGVGQAAGVMNQLLHSHVCLQVPSVRIISPLELEKEVGDLGKGEIAAVRLIFSGSFCGTASMVFPSESAVKLVSAALDEDPEVSDLNPIRFGTLSELGNIVINGVMGSISNVLNRHIDYSLPDYIEGGIGDLLPEDGPGPDTTILSACTRFLIEKIEIKGEIILIFEMGSFDSLLEAIEAIQSSSGVR